MPILRLNGIPYYLTVSELSKLPVIEKFVMYRDVKLRNKPFNNKDKSILTEFIMSKTKNEKEDPHQFISLIELEAKCACTELILYHIYFFCNNTNVYGYHKGNDTTSNQISLNDLYYPYSSWNAEIIFDALTINSGNSYYELELKNVEKVIGSFEKFKVILKNMVITFAFGKIIFESRTEINPTNKPEYYNWKDKKSITRIFRSFDRRNYKGFAFYLNDNFIYSNFYHPRLYESFNSYKNANKEIFDF